MSNLYSVDGIKVKILTELTVHCVRQCDANVKDYNHYLRATTQCI